jgi:hypothetical protein
MKAKALIDELSREAEKMLQHMQPKHVPDQSAEPEPRQKRKARDRAKSVRAEAIVPVIVQ